MDKEFLFECALYASVAIIYLLWGVSLRRRLWSKWAYYACTFGVWLCAVALISSDIAREFTGFYLAHLAVQLLLIGGRRYQVPN